MGWLVTGPLRFIVVPLHVMLIKLSGGRVGGKLFGAPVLMLTTVGAKSGQKRTVSLMYLDQGDHYVITASNGGLPRHPAWYHNLRKTPEVEVQTRGTSRPMVAQTATPEEAAELWPKIDRLYKGYAGYREKAGRTIPLVILREPERA